MFFLQIISYYRPNTNQYPHNSATRKEYLTNGQIIFVHKKSAFPQLYCLKSSFKFVNFSRSCTTKQKGLFVLNTLYINYILIIYLSLEILKNPHTVGDILQILSKVLVIKIHSTKMTKNMFNNILTQVL